MQSIHAITNLIQCTNDLPTATFALSSLIQAFPNPTAHRRHLIRATALLALAASIIRAETALLLFGLVCAVAIKETGAKTGYRATRDVVLTTVIVGLAGTLFSVAVDSYFWASWLALPRESSAATGFKGIIESGLRAVGFGRRWIWPELWGLLFNVVEGKSELWGVSRVAAFA